MTADLTNLLGDWPHEPGHLVVRLIEGDDQRPKIQVRLDLGLLQMNVDGRPDGLRPYGYDSLLEYYETCLDEEGAGPESDTDELDPIEAAFEDALDEDDDDAIGPADPGSDDDDDEAADTSGTIPDGRGDPPERESPGHLTSSECRALRDEAAQYYHRYVALMALEDYEGVVRDTSRNLRVLDLCQRFATVNRDRGVLEQFRPYIIMMRSRALASLSIKRGETKAAVFAIDQGLATLREYFDRIERPEMFESAGEAQMLRAMRDALLPKLPVSQRSELEQRMKVALSNENYELAAILRDELRMLGTVASGGRSDGGPPTDSERA